MKNSFCVFLDAGHGDLDEKGRYVTAGKMAEWQALASTSWGRTALFEGVWNRMLVNKIAKCLEHHGIEYQFLHHSWVDTNRPWRMAKVGYLSRFYKEWITISIHADWFKDPLINGFGLFLHRLAGYKSKSLAHWLHKMHADYFPDQRQRQLKYRNFDMVAVRGPAVLMENFFMSNEKEALLFTQPDIIKTRAEMIVDAIIRYKAEIGV